MTLRINQNRPPSAGTFVLLVSTLLMLIAAASALLFIQSWIRGVSLTQRTTVQSGSVIQPTNPTEQLTQYISLSRIVVSYRGRLVLISMRADELAKSRGLPRRISWHADAFPIRDQPRYDGPRWLAWLGFDWRFNRAQGPHPNGEYWSNRDVFLTVPYWALLLVFGGSGWLLDDDARGRLNIQDLIDAQAAQHVVATGAAIQDVIAIRAAHHVVPAAAEELVIAHAAIKHVVAFSPVEDGHRAHDRGTDSRRQTVGSDQRVVARPTFQSDGQARSHPQASTSERPR